MRKEGKEEKERKKEKEREREKEKEVVSRGPTLFGSGPEVHNANSVGAPVDV